MERGHLFDALMARVPDDASDTMIMGVRIRDMTDREVRAAALWLATQLSQFMPIKGKAR